MVVQGPGSVRSTFPVKPTTPVAPPQPTAPAQAISGNDRVEISTVGRMMEQLTNSGEVRAERLALLKSQIEAGVYESPAKLEAALAKMIAEIQSGDSSGNS